MKNLIFLIGLNLPFFSFSQSMDLERRSTSFPEMEDLLFIDFDQDGDEDLVGIEGSVLKFYIKDSLANFSVSTSSFTVLGDRLVTEDFNLDGFPDVLVYGSDQHRVYLSSGNGLFTAPANLILLDSGEKEYYDMDGDADLDLVSSITNGGVKVYENLNSLGFSSGTLIFENGGSLSTNEIGVGDINHDGINDIVRFSADNSIFAPDMSYYISNDSLNITIDTTISTNIPPTHTMTFADFNNDGLDDVMSSSGVYLYDTTINNYSHSFSISEWNPVANVKILDINNDGLLDININRLGNLNCHGCTTFAFYLSTDSGSFSPLNSNLNGFYYELGTALDVSDIDNDGDVDILFNGNYQYHNYGSGIYGVSTPRPFFFLNTANKGFDYSPFRDAFDFADVDNDGDLDLLQIGEYGWHYTNSRIFENVGGDNSRYVFEQKPQFLPGSSSGKCVLTDMNGDENIDILTYGYNPSHLRFNYFIGDTFDFDNSVTNYSPPYSLYPNFTTANFNGDSLTDCAFEVYRESGNVLKFTIQTDSLTFESTIMDSIYFQGDYQFFDLDNDGDDDLIIGGGITPDTSSNLFAKYYENDGSGQFTEIPNVFPANLQMNNIQFGDADLDGDIDIFAASNGYYSHFNILKQEPGMVFHYDSLISNIPQVNFEFEIVDIDGDFDLDIGILPLANNSSFAMYLNDNNDFSLLPTTGITSTFSKGFVKFLDMNGDDILDIFITDEDKVEFYMNPLCQTTVNYETVSECEAFVSPYSGSVFTESGEYLETLTQLNSNGCDSMVKWDLTLNTSSLDTLSVESCSAFTPPNSSEIWEETGFYHDSVLNVLGCDSVIVYNLTVNSIDLNISENANNELTTTNSSDDLQWLDCNNHFIPITGETNQVFSPNSNGSYALQFSNGVCIDTSACLTINSIGINSFSLGEWTSYPNPFKDELTVEISDGNSKVWITDLTGKVIWVKSEMIKDKVFQVSTLNWGNGIYLIHVQNSNMTSTKKTIK